MTKTHQFKSYAEATQIMSALHAAGKISTWCPVSSFGRVTAKIWTGLVWQKLDEAKFDQLIAA